MVEKKTLQEPTNLITDKCDVVIRGIRRTVLKIDWLHIKKRNDEFRNSKKKKIRENLDQYLLNPSIIKGFVQQLEGKQLRDEGVKKDWPNWKYLGYDEVIDKRNGMNYRILILIDDDNPEIVGVITVYPFE